MSDIKTELLKLIERKKIDGLGLRKIAKIIGEKMGNQNLDKQPETINYHLKKLEAEGLIIWNRSKKIFTKINKDSISNSSFIKIPVYGYASCGEALAYPDSISEHFELSPSMVGNRDKKNLFLVKASGNSLNKATGVIGGNIENDDYVLIDNSKRNPTNGEYVLSIINGMANLKRFYDKEDFIALVSESTENISPIFIQKEDINNETYSINGTVVRVIKQFNT